MSFKKSISLLLAVILVLSLNMTTVSAATGDYPDYPVGAKREAMISAVENGLLLGWGGKIWPSERLTRAQFSAVVNRALSSYEQADISAYDDVSESQWFYNDLAKIVHMGVFTDSETSLLPNKNITREEAYMALAQIFKLEPAKTTNALSKYVDIKNITKGTEKIWAALAEKGLLSSSGRILGPKVNISRADFAQIMYFFATQYIRDPGEYTSVAEGNILISSADVTLKDVAVTGDLIIADGVGDGDVTLDNVSVSGSIIARGGGENSIHIINNSKINNVVIARSNNTVRLAVQNSTVNNVTVNRSSGGAIIDGNATSILVQSESPVTLQNCETDSIQLAAANASVALSDNVVVNNFEITQESENAELLISEKATVKTVTTDAKNSIIDVKGTVENITAKSNAAGTKITSEATAKINKVVVNAVDTVIDGQGSVARVEANANNVRIATKNTEVAVAKNVTGVTSGNTTILGGTTVNTKDPTAVIKDQPTTPPATGNNTDSTSKPSPEKPLWTLVWSDEFNGTSLDTTKWRYDIGNGANGWGNNEKQYYQPENVRVENGKLILEAKREDTNGFKYSSGKILSDGKYSKTYGKIEASIKLPEGNGIWPAFWMMPQDSAYGVWAASGEIDIMEARGRLPNEIGGTIHYGKTSPDNKYRGATYHFPEGQSISNKYHLYTIEWEPGEIRWYVDGNLYQTLNDWFSTGIGQAAEYTYPAPFDQPFFSILNLAVGGNYDNGLEPDADFTSAQMEVDYVRIYELTGREYRTPVPPTIDSGDYPSDAKAPDATGNFISDTSFQNLILATSVDDVAPQDGWLAYAGGFGGTIKAATATDLVGSNGKSSKFAKVEITDAGSPEYSIQLMQKLPLAKGRYYKISFDAKADANRSMYTKIGDGGDFGWLTYTDNFKSDLTTSVRHFEYTFQMKENTHSRARLEFNLGLSDSTVYIGNVRIEEVDDPNPTPEISAKAPLADGNHVYNGTFDQGTASLVFWDRVITPSSAADISVKNKQLSVNVKSKTDAGAVKLIQNGMELLPNDVYKLSFDAKATAAREITVKLISKDGSTTYKEQTIALTSTSAQKSFEFTMPNVEDKEGQLVFLLGGTTGTITIDNVRMIRLSNNNISYDGITVFPLQNGDFSDGMNRWELVTDGASNSQTNIVDNALNVDIQTIGANGWQPMIMQTGMPLHKGFTYRVAFDITSTIDRTFDVALESDDGSYARRFQQTSVSLSANEKKSLVYEFTASVDDVVSLKFLFGPNSVPFNFTEHSITLDNVVFEIPGTTHQKPPSITIEPMEIAVGDDVIFKINNAAYLSAITDVKINGASIASTNYVKQADSIILAAANFTAADTYAIILKANGYADLITNVNIKSGDGNLLSKSSWLLWSGEGGDASFGSGDADAVVNVNSKGSDTWHIQLFQENVKLESGKTYELSFDGSSTSTRPILVLMETAPGASIFSPRFSLPVASDSFSTTFTAVADATVKFIFCLGDTPDGAQTVPTESHVVTLNNITLKETIPLGTNMLTNGSFANGSFEDNTSGWSFNWTDSTISIINEKAVITSYWQGDVNYHIQLLQDNLLLQEGKTYEMSLKASSSIDRVARVLVQVPSQGYDTFGRIDLNLTSNETTFSTTFTASYDAPTIFVICVGYDEVNTFDKGVVHTITLDDIVLKEISNAEASAFNLFAEPLEEEMPVDEAIAEEPIVEEPAVEESIVEEPAVEESAVEEPTTDETTVDEALSNEATEDEPSEDNTETDDADANNLPTDNADAILPTEEESFTESE